MPKRTQSYTDWLGSKLSDPKRAARYLNAAQEDSPAMFLKALRKVAAAQPAPMTELAEAAKVSREGLYRMMSETGNPTYDSLKGILNAMGLKLEVVPLGASTGPARPSKRAGTRKHSTEPDSVVRANSLNESGAGQQEPSDGP
jgi:probable addiction module antidote protein